MADDRYEISLEPRYGHLEVIDVPALVAGATAAWSNQTLTRVDGNVVRLGIVQGEFHWHRHDDEDELFFVLEGELIVDIEDGPSLTLGPHQGTTVPRGHDAPDQGPGPDGDADVVGGRRRPHRRPALLRRPGRPSRPDPSPPELGAGRGWAYHDDLMSA